MFVPVIDHNQQPLMPTTPSRARRWIRSGKATGFWKRGVFMVRLNSAPSDRKTQPVIVGIDPGSRREGFSVVSATHTFLNIQTATPDWVKDAVETRRNMRRTRRYRKTPCRANRQNRAQGYLPPSTKARWQWKLRVCWWLKKMFPITAFVVEDVKATTKRGKRWNQHFSPMHAGKQFFHEELQKLGRVETRQGWETAQLRERYGLKKSSNKLAETFTAHAVDAWCLANSWLEGQTQPEQTTLFCLTPLRFHRRQLHRLQPEAGGKRKLYGGTRSNGFKRGSLVKHPKFGVCYVGGYLKDRVSLHALADGKRLTKQAKPEDCVFLTYCSWRYSAPPSSQDRGFRACA
jgi:hypothetical protein